MARIAITERDPGTYVVNLTDSRLVWERRTFGDPAGALAYVWHLSELGHKVALPTALARLKATAVTYRAPTAMAAD